jgi:2-alkenal reductase
MNDWLNEPTDNDPLETQKPADGGQSESVPRKPTGGAPFSAWPPPSAHEAWRPPRAAVEPPPTTPPQADEYDSDAERGLQPQSSPESPRVGNWGTNPALDATDFTPRPELSRLHTAALAARPGSRQGRLRRAANRLATLIAVIAIAGSSGAAGAAALLFWSDRPAESQERTAVATTADSQTAPVPISAAIPVLAEPFLETVRAARPAVVTVLNLRAVRRSRNSPVTHEPLGQGSGVIFDARGYIATNSHVIQGNQGIEILFLDGRRAPAEVVGQDSDYDVAILKVASDVPLPALALLGDSSQVEPGMAVLAIGSPLGAEYKNTVTTGIIAGLNRQLTQERVGFDPARGWVRVEESVNHSPLIQTDAAINSGNSGGPLINMQGEVIGLNTLVVRSGAEASVEGLGLAVPSNVVAALAAEWIDRKPRPALGIAFETIDYGKARDRGLDVAAGAQITRVAPGTAAARANLAQGDLILAIDGTPLNADHALTDLLWRYHAGDEVTLTVRRGAETFAASVTLDAVHMPSQ